jgi:iron complex outermembrane receptor protein
VRGFALRGTASTGFRAPTLQQEHYSSASTISVNGVLLPVQALPVDTPAAIALGAKPLKPERSTNLSVGMVFTAIPRLTVTVDAYQIRSGTASCCPKRCRAPRFSACCNRRASSIRRGLLLLQRGQHPHARAGCGGHLSLPEQAGQFNLSLSANLNKTVFTHIDDLPDVLKNAGLVLIGRSRQGDFTGTPRSKIIGSVNWSKDAFTAMVRATRYGSVTQTSSYYPGTAAYAAAPDATCRPQDAGGSGTGLSDQEGHQADGWARTICSTSIRTGCRSRCNPRALLYNPYAPYGYSGRLYYGRLNFSF